MRKRKILISILGVLVLSLSACVPKDEVETDATGVQNYDRDFIDTEELADVLESYNPDVFTELNSYSVLRISEDGRKYNDTNISEEELSRLIQNISDLQITEVREKLDDLERRDLKFLDDEQREEFYITISYDTESDLYFINGEILPNSMVDPTRSFKIINNDEIKDIISLCDELLES